MTTHLTDLELVDHMDGALPAARAAHLEGCHACRRHADSLRHVMVTVQHADDASVPEPSPLFWDHFSQRVHDAVRDAEPAAQAWPWFRAPSIAWVTATVVVVLAATAIFWREASKPPLPGSRPSIAVDQRVAPGGAERQPPPDTDLNDDVEWGLVRMAADDLRWEDAAEAGINARPGSAERVALEMSPAERRELEKLIEDEMKRTGA